MNDLLKTAMDAALRAGGAILQIYARDFEVEFKADESPLTEADKAAHCIICDALEDTGIPILSEESKAIDVAERKGWDRYWLVDPLDGTMEFIKKNGEFTVNIALIDDGRPVMGVVYAPVLKTIYWGSVHDGACKTTGCDEKSVDEITASGEPLPLRSVIDNRQSAIKVVASRSHCNDETKAFIEALEKDGPVELVSSGSSLKLCLVAEGSADVYPRIAPTMEWDTAAAHAVVAAAGKRVVQYDSSVPAVSYLGDNGQSRAELHSLVYNKEDLLNPHFVVMGG